MLLLAAAVLAACGESPTEPSDIVAVTWRLRTLQASGAGPVVVSNPERFTLRLEPDGQAGVRADCNGCGGRYTLAGETLNVSVLACTLVLCPSTPLDGQFVSILDGVTQARVEDDTLILTSSEGSLRMIR